MLTNANTAGDFLTGIISTQLQNDDLLGEAISAKAEWIEKLIIEGEEVGGHSLESIVDDLLCSNDMNQLLRTVYSTGETRSIRVAIENQVNKLAYKIAPNLVQADHDQGVDYD